MRFRRGEASCASVAEKHRVGSSGGEAWRTQMTEKHRALQWRSDIVRCLLWWRSIMCFIGGEA